jgi:hypothetical protein
MPRFSVRVTLVGGVIIAVVLLVFPVVVGLSGAVIAAILGGLTNARVDDRHAGSELLDLNR